MKPIYLNFLFLIMANISITQASEYGTNTIKNGGIFFLKGWSNHISKIDGPRCAYSPTCAGYARQAVEKYGAKEGYFMAMERLQRCHSCHDYSQYDIKEGRFDDSVEANRHD